VLGQAKRDLPQQLVTVVMAETVVDRAKTIQVNVKNRKRVLLAVRLQERMFQAAEQKAPVGQSGQWVKLCNAAQPGFILTLLG
jgi:hypothetical protein